MHDHEPAGRGKAADLLAVGRQQLDRGRDEAPVGLRRGRLLDARVREAVPEPRDVVGELVGPVERLAAERILVVQVGRADLRERGPIAAAERVAEAGQQVVDPAQNSGRPVSGVDASA